MKGIKARQGALQGITAGFTSEDPVLEISFSTNIWSLRLK